jgi:isochorismate synthase EntC
LGNVQHLETPIHGRLAPSWGVLDVAAALHPTPALGGWPKEAAQAYLAEAEPFNRGWYAAPVGWFDPWGNGLFAVAIRSGLLQGSQASLFAGAGIVEGSDPLQEWQETGLKFRPMLEAIGAQETD